MTSPTSPTPADPEGRGDHADVTRRMYDSERNRHRESALSSLTWLEGRLAEIRRSLEADGSVVAAVGSARNAAGDLADMTVSLARVQTLDEWAFVVNDGERPEAAASPYAHLIGEPVAVRTRDGKTYAGRLVDAQPHGVCVDHPVASVPVQDVRAEDIASVEAFEEQSEEGSADA